jgi:hypothetical protein
MIFFKFLKLFIDLPHPQCVQAEEGRLSLIALIFVENVVGWIPMTPKSAQLYLESHMAGFCAHFAKLHSSPSWKELFEIIILPPYSLYCISN